MGELIDRDQEHLRLLKLGFYLLAGTSTFFSLFALLYAILGSFLASGVIPQAKDSTEDPRLIGWIFTGVSLVVFVLGTIGSYLTYFAGRSLAERRRRTFCMIMAGLWCLSIPFGTAIGICAIVVLNRTSVKGLFEGKTWSPLISP